MASKCFVLMNNNLPVVVPSVRKPVMIALRDRLQVQRFSKFLNNNYKEYELKIYAEYRDRDDGIPVFLRCCRYRTKCSRPNVLGLSEVQTDVIVDIMKAHERQYTLFCDLGILGCDSLEVKYIVHVDEK